MKLFDRLIAWIYDDGNMPLWRHIAAIIGWAGLVFAVSMGIGLAWGSLGL